MRITLLNLLLAWATASLTVAAPIPVPRKPVPPQIRFIGSPGVGSGFVALRFEAYNPTGTALPYIGYVTKAFDPPLKNGQIAPLYRVEVRKGNDWKGLGVGWCGTGIASRAGLLSFRGAQGHPGGYMERRGRAQGHRRPQAVNRPLSAGGAIHPPASALPHLSSAHTP
jgi:hypothetical protein